MSIAEVTYGAVGDGETITIDDTVGGKGFTVSKITVPSAQGTLHASKAEFKVEVAPIRFTRDGSAPTTTTGIPAAIGDVITIEPWQDVEKFRAIRETGSSAIINPEYSR